MVHHPWQHWPTLAFLMAQGERIWPRRGDRSYRNTFTPERSRNQKFNWRHTSAKWSRSAPVPYPSLLRQGEGGILRTESSRFASSAEEVLGVLKATWFGGVSVLFGVEFVLHWPLRLVEAIMANNADLFFQICKGESSILIWKLKCQTAGHQKGPVVKHKSYKVKIFWEIDLEMVRYT